MAASARDFERTTDPSDWFGVLATLPPSLTASSSSSSTSKGNSSSSDAALPLPSSLRELDQSLRCELCYDLFVAPVSFRACGHAFCSACIRQHVNQPQAKGKFCPKCRQTKASDGELVPQPSIESATFAWRRTREALMSHFRAVAEFVRLAEAQAASAAAAAAGQSRSASFSSSKRKRADPQPSLSPAAPLASQRRESLRPRKSSRLECSGSASAGSAEDAGAGASRRVAGGKGERSIYCEIEPGVDDDEDSDGFELLSQEVQSAANGGPNGDGKGKARGRGARHDSDDDSEFEMLDDDASVGHGSRRASHDRPGAANGKAKQVQESRRSPERSAQKQQSDAELRAQSEVECPVCTYSFTLVALNRHLDEGCDPSGPPPTLAQRGLEDQKAAEKVAMARQDPKNWFVKPKNTGANDSKRDSAGGRSAQSRETNGHSSAGSKGNGFGLPGSSSNGVASIQSLFSKKRRGAHEEDDSDEPSITHVAAPEPRRLVRPAYYGKKDKDLRALLAEQGLPTTGATQKMVDRHSQWINLFNGNLDASAQHRKTTAALKRELAEWEKQQESAAAAAAARAKASAGAGAGVGGGAGGNSAASVVDVTGPRSETISERELNAWISKNKEQFDELTRAAIRSGLKLDRERRRAGAQVKTDTNTASREEHTADADAATA